jgi:hypothetical protein
MLTIIIIEDQPAFVKGFFHELFSSKDLTKRDVWGIITPWLAIANHLLSRSG